MARPSEVRKGTVIEYNNDLFVITEYEHRTPGNLRAFFQIKIKGLSNGQTTSLRLSASDTLEVAYLDKKPSEYLYQEANGDYIFMDSTTYEQFPLSHDLVGYKMGFVKANEQALVTFHGTTPIGIELPPSVVLEIREAEFAVKGNTATNVKKDAVLETGHPIKVPLHIKAGELVKVSTETGEFMGRAKD